MSLSQQWIQQNRGTFKAGGGLLLETVDNGDRQEESERTEVFSGTQKECKRGEESWAVAGN